MEEETCYTDLGLGLGCRDLDRERKPPVKLHLLFPHESAKEEMRSDEDEEVVMKENNSTVGDDHVNDDIGVGNARKKLRLTKEQTSLLEESFRQHNTLTPAQKQELAEQLNLRARQVEVWFQNRRARTKLKQTEVDCEFLKKCCESLSDENRRLKRELQELRSINPGAASPFYMNLSKTAAVTTMTVCPSCERNSVGKGGRITTGATNNGGLDFKPKLYGTTVKDSPSNMAC
ncbi:Homeobox-leucine zipper protein HAT22 [Acorus calamus]|uniref:Homeobox-leucine zipper protein HAT22 n=1 Tax=Acorus calamus TaxID=4465 RepID=A0AAV9CP97_ACOCL|nr:Homeobox-leucine zipper protein HAT22 [Acorus calamus]